MRFQFGYYCGRTKRVKQSISIQMIGVMIGSIVFGYFSDNYGRKIVRHRLSYGCLILSLDNAWSSQRVYYLHACLVLYQWSRLVHSAEIPCELLQRRHHGVSRQCLRSPLIRTHFRILVVFMVENLPKKDRFWIQNLITWSPNIVVFALVAYLSHDWRTLTRASAGLALPAVALLM